MAELAAFADGTLPVERRAAVEARLASSAELRAFVERQQRALAATRALAAEPVPATLGAAVAAGTPHGRRRAACRRLAWRLGAAGALVAVVAAVVVLRANRVGPAAPSLAAAAGIARQAPSGAAPAPLGSRGHDALGRACRASPSRTSRRSTVGAPGGAAGSSRRPRGHGRVLRQGRPTDRLRDRGRLGPRAAALGRVDHDRRRAVPDAAPERRAGRDLASRRPHLRAHLHRVCRRAARLWRAGRAPRWTDHEAQRHDRCRQAAWPGARDRSSPVAREVRDQFPPPSRRARRSRARNRRLVSVPSGSCRLRAASP